VGSRAGPIAPVRSEEVNTVTALSPPSGKEPANCGTMLRGTEAKSDMAHPVVQIRESGN
jgi:hypothetical protein